MVAGSGIALAFAFYEWGTFSAAEAAQRLKPLHAFLVNKWYFDELYRAVFVRPTLALARGVARWEAELAQRSEPRAVAASVAEARP